MKTLQVGKVIVFLSSSSCSCVTLMIQRDHQERRPDLMQQCDSVKVFGTEHSVGMRRRVERSLSKSVQSTYTDSITAVGNRTECNSCDFLSVSLSLENMWPRDIHAPFTLPPAKEVANTISNFSVMSLTFSPTNREGMTFAFSQSLTFSHSLLIRFARSSD